MLKKSYILSFIIDAKFNIQNKIFVISVLGLGGVVFHSVWGVIPPPERNTAWNKRQKCFHCFGTPNNSIRPCHYFVTLSGIIDWYIVGLHTNVNCCFSGVWQWIFSKKFWLLICHLYISLWSPKRWIMCVLGSWIFRYLFRQFFNTRVCVCIYMDFSQCIFLVFCLMPHRQLQRYFFFIGCMVVSYLCMFRWRQVNALAEV